MTANAKGSFLPAVHLAPVHRDGFCGSPVQAGILITCQCLLLAAGLFVSATGKAETPSDLQISLSTDEQTYIPGQSVHLALTLTNPKDTDLTLSFRSSHQYDFMIKRRDQEVWRWSHGRMFAQVLTQLVLAPHETRTFRATWDQKDRDGKQVPSDSYEVLGLLLTEDRTYTATTSMHILKPTPAGLTK